MLNKLIFQACL